MAVLIVVIVIVVLLALGLWAGYNGLVKRRNRTQEAWSEIDVELKRRHDLIPNLVSTVQGYAAHEKGRCRQVRHGCGKCGFNGGPDGTERLGIGHWNHCLLMQSGQYTTPTSRTSSAGTCCLLRSWSGRRESNPRPTAWKAETLPLSYSRILLPASTLVRAKARTYRYCRRILELMMGLEPMTSPLPRECSTTELQDRKS